jgi:hypothetical protein
VPSMTPGHAVAGRDGPVPPRIYFPLLMLSAASTILRCQHTWTYTTEPTIEGQPRGVGLGAFSEMSVYSITTHANYASRGINYLRGQTGQFSDNFDDR